MNSAIIIALIALIGSVLSTVITVFWTPAVNARRDAKSGLEKYREPLLAASYELQARIYNILQLQFIEIWTGRDNTKRSSAIETTLYVFAQFFGWREIVRREIQHFRFPRDRQTREIARLLGMIDEAFLSDAYGHQIMIWRVEQRGLGERMIVSNDRSLKCMGYASFLDRQDTMKEWLGPIQADILKLDDGGRRRLTEVQHLLIALIRKLDAAGVRYPLDLREAQLSGFCISFMNSADTSLARCFL
jgi:hypothetical protein